MTALPPKAELDGSSSGHNQGVFKTAIGALRDYLSGLFGTDGTQASALAALKVLDPQAVYNLSPVFTVGSNALTCTIKDRAGNDLSSTNPAFVGQRSATASDGGFNLRAMTANVALTISSGSTLGHANGVAGKLYWYLLDNAGVQVLAVSGSFQGFSGIYSTTAEGGAGAADSGSVVYAAAAHSNLPGRLIAVTTDTQTTAGTWAATPSLVSVNPIPPDPETIGALPTAGGMMTGDITMSGASIVEAEGAAVASASSCNIWATDGNTVHVTGTTTINDFGTAPQAGAWMKVIFDGDLTLTQSANLNLNGGGANLAVKAGDIAFVYADTTTQMDVLLIRKDGGRPQNIFVKVSKGDTQSVSNNTATKVQFNNVDHDPFNYFDESTNYRFTPLVAGWYRVNAFLRFLSPTDQTPMTLQIYKNGGQATQTALSASGTGNHTLTTHDIIYMNGSTDYLEIYCHQVSGGSLSVGTASVCDYVTFERVSP